MPSHLILVLEDTESRIKVFKQKFIGHVLKIFSNANNAIDYLKQIENEPQNHFDQIYLDHDLDGMNYVDYDSYDNTGMKLVRWMATERPSSLFNIPINVHSHNAHAAFVMRETLLKAGFISYLTPFWQIEGQLYKGEINSDKEISHFNQVLDNVKYKINQLHKSNALLRGDNENNIR